MTRVLLIGMVLFLSFTGLVYAKTITLSWDASPSQIAGYKLYYKAGSSTVPLDGVGADQGASPIDVGNVLTYAITGLPDGEEHSITLTAYDSAGYESSYSNMVKSPVVFVNVSTSDFELSQGLFVDNNTINANTIEALDLSWKYYIGVVAPGDQINLDTLLYYTDGSNPLPEIREVSPHLFYVIDIDTGERISNEVYAFVDNSYRGYQADLIISKASINSKLIVEYGEIPGQYQCQIKSINIGQPAIPAVTTLYMRELLPATATGSIDVVFGIEQPIPFPASYHIKIGPTLHSVSNGVVGLSTTDEVVQNTGQISFQYTLSPELEAGMFFSISAITADGSESASNITGYLRGNVLGTIDDGTNFKDLIIDSADVYKAAAFYRARTLVPASGDFSAVAIERADVINYGRIVLTQYLYIRQNFLKKFNLYLPW